MTAFFGAALDIETMGRLYATIDPSLRRHDKDGLRTRWFDYHAWHPIKTTFFFAHCYNQEYKYAAAKYIDYRFGEHARGLKNENVFKESKRNLTGILKGRAFADALGMPYPTYLHLAFDNYMRCGNRNFLPRPTNLYGDIFLKKAYQYWRYDETRPLVLAEDALFRPDQYRNLAVQNRYYVYLIRCLATTHEGRTLVKNDAIDRLLPPSLHDIVFHVYREFGEKRS